MDDDIKVEVEYVYEQLPEDDDTFKEFAHIFEKFSKLGSDQFVNNEDEIEPSKKDVTENSGQFIEFTESSQQRQTSKKKLKQINRMSVTELKRKIPRPELVELHDVTAKDPILLLHLKATKNSVPVPRHWSSKRKYLQGKRGYEKPPFLLPDFIRQTGIMEMRDAIQDKDSGKSLKSKMREKIRPKVGKIQMDYQQLHDAFFKWQTKPQLSMHGDLYYEGKEFEKKYKFKPGELSEELRKALGMPTGQGFEKYPPPWVSAMRRHGPPPSYPYLQPLETLYEI